MQKRIKQIEGIITALSKDKYSNKELLEELDNFKKQILSCTYDGVHAENMKLKLYDVAQYLKEKNQESGNLDDEMLDKFEVKCKEIDYKIGRMWSGRNGEKKAFKSLEVIKNKHEVIKNVELVKDDSKAELDAVVITSKAIFIIEVKNSNQDMIIDKRGNYYKARGEMSFDYNIGDKFNEKESLILAVLRDAGVDNINIVNLVVFTNNKAKLENRYTYIKKCSTSQLPHIIEEYNGKDIYSNEMIEKIAEIIKIKDCKEEYDVDFDYIQFKEEFALILASIENTTESDKDDIEVDECVNNKQTNERSALKYAKYVSIAASIVFTVCGVTSMIKKHVN